MLLFINLFIASFVNPVQIGTDPFSLLWLLPLVVSIAVIYKLTKMPMIRTGEFLKESAVLSIVIIAFMVIAASMLHLFAWVIVG